MKPINPTCSFSAYLSFNLNKLNPPASLTTYELKSPKAINLFPDPIEAIKFRMEQAGLKPKDLASLLGSRSKVSEVLSGRRTLSLSMIRNLHRELGIPAEVLLQEPGARIPR